jgi:1-acyl-sn-glycerol-3-phosphate acyltransferase
MHPEKYPLEVRYERVRHLCLRLCKVFHVKINVTNEPVRDKTYYFVSNHISLLDPIIFIAASKKPIIVIGKKETRKMPLVGRVIRSIDGLFLDRGNLRQEVTVYAKLKAILETNYADVVIFPEGTRNKSYNGPLNELKPGSFKSPVVTNTVIKPLVIWGSQFILRTDFHYKKYLVYIDFLEDVNPHDFSDTVVLAEDLQDKMQARVDEARHRQAGYLGVKLSRRQIKFLGS